MEHLKFNLSKNDGKFKIMNATNGGSCHKRHANDQYRTNLDDYIVSAADGTKYITDDLSFAQTVGANGLEITYTTDDIRKL